MNHALSILVGLNLGLLACGAQQVYRLNPTTSRIQIHLGTAGAAGFLGHPHLIETPIKQGTFVYHPNEPGRSSVELAVDASALRVMDPKRPEKERGEIQATMQSDRVLGSKQFSAITFKSVNVEPRARDHLAITGNLTIRSQTRPVKVDVTLEQAGGHLKAVGKSQFLQTTFGIRPVTAGLGTVRVRDRMEITFVVFGEPESAAGAGRGR